MYAAAQHDTVRRPDGYITIICARTVSRVFQHQQECSPEPAGPQDRVLSTDLRFNQRESSFIPHLTASHRCSLEVSPAPSGLPFLPGRWLSGPYLSWLACA